VHHAHGERRSAAWAPAAAGRQRHRAPLSQASGFPARAAGCVPHLLWAASQPLLRACWSPAALPGSP
jgi:hypothetical protein